MKESERKAMNLTKADASTVRSSRSNSGHNAKASRKHSMNQYNSKLRSNLCNRSDNNNNNKSISTITPRKAKPLH